MSVSEYEFFGVTDYENAKNTRDTISESSREGDAAQEPIGQA